MSPYYLSKAYITNHKFIDSLGKVVIVARCVHYEKNTDDQQFPTLSSG
jgi:hypothetical protein